MKVPDVVLTALEVASFATISIGVCLAWGVAAALIAAGAAGVYLVNAYSLPPPGDEPDD